jgi:hypothetical protein
VIRENICLKKVDMRRTVLKGSQDAGQRRDAKAGVTANPDPSEIRALLQQRLASTLANALPADDPGIVEARRLVAQGDIPIGAIRLQGSREGVRRFLEKNQCEIYAIRAGSSAQPPLLSAAVDPS